jgi:cytochrome c551/c552
VDVKKCAVKGVKVSEDGRIVRIVVDSLRQHFIHTISLEGVRDVDNSFSLVHPTVYYTLNNFPDGNKLSAAELSTFNSSLVKVNAAASPGGSKAAKPTASAIKPSISANKKITTEEIRPLLVKHTCTACHAVDKKQVGPAFTEIAKRKYTSEKIVNLIYNPQPSNWPDYSTPMAPMPQVPKSDALKIADWINALGK